MCFVKGKDGARCLVCRARRYHPVRCIFYAKGKSNEEHLKKEKFRARSPRKTKKIQEIKEIVRLVKV